MTLACGRACVWKLIQTSYLQRYHTLVDSFLLILRINILLFALDCVPYFVKYLKI
jgi:hypothetical protein